MIAAVFPLHSRQAGFHAQHLLSYCLHITEAYFFKSISRERFSGVVHVIAALRGRIVAAIGATVHGKSLLDVAHNTEYKYDSSVAFDGSNCTFLQPAVRCG